MTIRSKKDLELELSKLKGFDNPRWELEQYATPASIAAEWIWQMALNREVAGKIILDAACGPGILGIGLLIMGAKEIYFLDKDQQALSVCEENYQTTHQNFEIGKAHFMHNDISLFDHEVDIVVQNPPFGTNNKHLDKKFIEVAFRSAPVIYSMHKWSTKQFVEAICKDHNYVITHCYRHDFPIKATFKHHTKPVQSVDVGLWRMERMKKFKMTIT